MARTGTKKNQESGGGATTGYERELWEMANALRGSMDAAIDTNLESLGFGSEERSCA